MSCHDVNVLLIMVPLNWIKGCSNSSIVTWSLLQIHCLYISCEREANIPCLHFITFRKHIAS